MKVALPSHDLIVIGFDSGELQVYRGIDETGSEAPEPGKKIPILIVSPKKNWIILTNKKP